MSQSVDYFLSVSGGFQRYDERVKTASADLESIAGRFLDFPISARWIAHVTRARLGAWGVRDSRPWAGRR